MDRCTLTTSTSETRTDSLQTVSFPSDGFPTLVPGVCTYSPRRDVTPTSCVLLLGQNNTVQTISVVTRVTEGVEVTLPKPTSSSVVYTGLGPVVWTEVLVSTIVRSPLIPVDRRSDPGPDD